MQWSTPAVAFVATIAVVVPAGWHAPEANLDPNGPASRPERRVISVDGAQITVSVNSRVVGADGMVYATISGTAPTRRDIDLDIKFSGTGQTQSRQQRHATPVTMREEKHVVIDAGPTPGEATLAFTARKIDASAVGTFDLFELEVVPSMDVFQTQPNGAPNKVRIGIAGWTGSAIPVVLSAPKVTAEGPFEVDVKVTNTSKTALDLWVDFGAPSWIANGSKFEYEQDPDYRLEPIAVDESPLAAGGERTYRYRLVPAREGLHTFLVLANVHGADGRLKGTDRATRERYANVYGGWGSLDTATFDRPKH